MHRSRKTGSSKASDEIQPGTPECDECPICLEPLAVDTGSSKRHKGEHRADASGTVKKREVFPCSYNHVLCVECSAKVDVCPLCRQGRDGSSQCERIARAQEQRPRIAFSRFLISRSRTHQNMQVARPASIFFSIPSTLAHPLDANNLTVRVGANVAEADDDVAAYLISLLESMAERHNTPEQPH